MYGCSLNNCASRIRACSMGNICPTLFRAPPLKLRRNDLLSDDERMILKCSEKGSKPFTGVKFSSMKATRSLAPDIRRTGKYLEGKAQKQIRNHLVRPDWDKLSQARPLTAQTSLQFTPFRIRTLKRLISMQRLVGPALEGIEVQAVIFPAKRALSQIPDISSGRVISERFAKYPPGQTSTVVSKHSGDFAVYRDDLVAQNIQPRDLILDSHFTVSS